MTMPAWGLKRLAQAILLTVTLAIGVGASAPPYDLSHTDGMNCFTGSAEVEKLLEQQGFVVAGHNYELDGTSWLAGSVLRFDSPTKLHGLVMGKDRISRLAVEIHSN